MIDNVMAIHLQITNQMNLQHLYLPFLVDGNPVGIIVTNAGKSAGHLKLEGIWLNGYLSKHYTVLKKDTPGKRLPRPSGCNRFHSG